MPNETALYGVAKTIRIVRFPDAPEKGDVSDWLDAHPHNADTLADVCFDAPLWGPGSSGPSAGVEFKSWWREPADIPKREFLYGRHYARRNIGGTIGAGGRAKTTQGVYEAVSMAVGRNLATKEKLPCGPLRVWILNGEEDQDELDRRLAATCLRYDVTEADLGGRLFAQSVRDKPMRIATLVKNMPVLNEAAVKYMTDFIEHRQIDVFMIDPLVSFHAVPENDNTCMDLVIKEGFGAIAKQDQLGRRSFSSPRKA